MSLSFGWKSLDCSFCGKPQAQDEKLKASLQCVYLQRIRKGIFQAAETRRSDAMAKRKSNVYRQEKRKSN